LGGERTGDGGYTAPRLNACHWVIANAIFDRKSSSAQSEGSFYAFLHLSCCFYGMKRVVPIETITSALTLCSSKALTMMCCHHLRPREANILHVIPKASGRKRTINF
jgi:hypothetical protein